MINTSLLQKALPITAGIIILTLTGIFTVFETRSVISGQLYLSSVILALMVGGTGYFIALKAREEGAVASIVHSVLSSLIVGFALAVLVVIETTINMRFVFQNLRSLSESSVTLGRIVSIPDGQFEGLIALLLVSVVFGLLAGALANLPRRAREVILTAASLTIVIGLVARQVNSIMTLPDTLMLVLAFTAGYAASFYLPRQLEMRLAGGVGVGVIIGIISAIIANSGGLDDGGIFRQFSRAVPEILAMSTNGFMAVAYVAVLGVFGAAGVAINNAAKTIHDGSLYFFVGLLVVGVMSWQQAMTVTAAALIFPLLLIPMWFVPLLGKRAESSYEAAPQTDQRVVQIMFWTGMMLILLIAPHFTGRYISNVFNLIALYAIMGIGLNVMIGLTGLLDLGYVASFAIGAYTLGILTTPNLLTCGGVHPNQIPPAEIADICTGVTTFWLAWPFCVFFSATTGMLLGVPVLRLRGDYLAIVTLGFGEIINRIILSNDFRPILGGAQGITPIPSPVLNFGALNPDWSVSLNNSTSIYYLFLFGVIVAAFVVLRLINTRVGRAWRAIREDEDVAQAMGIDLMRYKLLAFGISSAFAGLGGAAFAASVQGIFPNSFTLLVSINVLSLVIIGGMGSIPGVFLGAAILIGMPELLRELDAYRLLVFGSILVTVMLLKPEGLMPPRAPELEQKAREQKVQEEASHA